MVENTTKLSYQPPVGKRNPLMSFSNLIFKVFFLANLYDNYRKVILHIIKYTFYD